MWQRISKCSVGNAIKHAIRDIYFLLIFALVFGLNMCHFPISCARIIKSILRISLDKNHPHLSFSRIGWVLSQHFIEMNKNLDDFFADDTFEDDHEIDLTRLASATSQNRHLGLLSPSHPQNLLSKNRLNTVQSRFSNTSGLRKNCH